MEMKMNAEMTDFNFNLLAELYQAANTHRRKGCSYRRFDTAAEAIRFAIEDLSSSALSGCILEVDEERLGAKELKELYASPDFPRHFKTSAPGQ